MFPMATPSVHTGVICIPLRPVATHTHTRYYYYLKTGSQITEPGVRGRAARSAPGVVTSPELQVHRSVTLGSFC